GRINPPEGTYKQIAAGSDHTCAITTDGDVACWGDNAQEQCALQDGLFTQVTAGGNHSCAIREQDQQAQCWGENGNGESTPPPGAKFVQVSAGESHTCGMTTDGYVRCWGSDAGGRATPTLAFAAAEQMEAGKGGAGEEEEQAKPQGGQRMNVPTGHKREALSS